MAPQPPQSRQKSYPLRASFFQITDSQALAGIAVPSPSLAFSGLKRRNFKAPQSITPFYGVITAKTAVASLWRMRSTPLLPLTACKVTF